MRLPSLLLAALAALMISAVAETAHARGGRAATHTSATRSHPATTTTHSASNHASRSTASSGTRATRSRAMPGVARDTHGRIRRSAAARDAFRHSNPCPATGRSTGRCPGYVIDHVQALKHGGADTPANMQWQTTGAAKAKDKVE